METKTKTEPAEGGTDEGLESNKLLSKNVCDEENNHTMDRFGFKRTVPDEDSLHGKQDTNTSKENNTNKPLFHEQNITQTSVPDFTKSSSLFSCTGNLSKDDNNDKVYPEDFSERTRSRDKKHKKKEKDVRQEVLHPDFRCRFCGGSPVCHCNSCNLNFCENCNVQHHFCTRRNLHDFHQRDEKGHLRYLENINPPNIQMVHSTDTEFPQEMHYNFSSTGNLVDKAQFLHRTFEYSEPFSDTNTKQHSRFKQFMESGKFEDVRGFRNIEPSLSAKEFTEKFLCEPCSSENLQVQATHFCKTCDDPELLCETCAKHHTKQKICKNHELSEDTRDFRKRKPKIEKEFIEKHICEPCFTENQQVQATHFCKTCDDPELLCETCAKHHTKQKIFKNHELSEDIRDFRKRKPKIENDTEKMIICGPCSSEELQVQATHFCKTCDDPEPLCEICAKHHTKQKLSKNHILSENMKDFLKSEKVTLKKIFCQPCSSENLQIQATQFCKSCDDPEPLCETCAKYHTKQKLFKNHELCGDLKDLRKRENDIVKEILCEPCITENIQVSASFFCKTCEDPEPLCDICARHHTKQKLSKNHELCEDITDFRKSKSKIVKDIFCEPCSTENKHVVATFFCKTCDDPEPLCHACAKHHTKQKLSKDHELCGNLKEFQKSDSDTMKDTLCEPCSTENLRIQATNYCKTCDDPEALCDICAKQHTKQTCYKNHELCKDMEEFRNREPTLCMIKDTDKVCEPCLNENVQTIATHFCQTCEDPEPLCEICAKQHIRQKISKAHKLCSDIQKFLKHQPPPTCNNKETNKVCEPCSNEGKQITATHFCKTCNDPELLCETCAKEHTRQKISKYHILCDKIDEFPQIKTQLCKNNETEKNCGPCSDENKQITATHFCKTCDDPEPLCEACAKEHNRHKISKDHELSDKMEEYPQSKSNVCQNKETEKNCGPCSEDNKHITATHFCKTCTDPEPLCEACAKEHNRHKISKDHELSDKIEEYPQSKSNVCINKKTEMFCEPCFNENKQISATRFCKTCADPEPLCEKCAKQHIRQKISKEHKLCSDIQEFPKLKPHPGKNKDIDKCCNLCLKKNKSSKATHICKTCDDPEPLCKKCAEQHAQQEINKDHTFCDLNFLPTSNFSGYAKKPRKEAGDKKSPGKPSSTDTKSNSVALVWEKSVENVTHYQVRYKCSNKVEKWKFTETDSNQNCLVITGLMAKTEYTFQVRGVFEDVEGPYGQVSDSIETSESLATNLLDFCECLTNGHPSKYRLPAEENSKARNEIARTKQLVFGNAPPVSDEKTILLVGATGSGKSTLVDGFVNYLMGVSFDDPFRFTTAMLEHEEMKTHNQAVSQTEWITVYKLHPKPGSRLSYTLNIIDTPGFGDTRGIERDNAIVDQIRHLFCSQGEDGVLYIDAVCFIVKAPDARLTVVQKYIFSSMMALFGKDIESNICTLITFADGAEPPVLASLKESKLPHETTFTFNNSALFAENKDLANNTLSPMFWEMGCRSFESFFKHVKDLKAASLCQTKDVLEEREQLKFVISNIRPQITAGLSKLSELQQKLDIFQRCKSDIENNQNFEYTVEETKQRMLELLPGQHVTNCLHCNITCHEECRIPDDEEKKRCWAMDKDGNCRICPEKCIWSEHKNTSYIFKYVTEKVTKTYAEMKERYEEAIGKTITHEKYIEDLTYCVDDMFEEINSMMNEMNRCKTRLKEIALRPDPLSAVEHIDLMIQSEQEEKQPGHLNRVKMLKEFRKMALVDQDVEDLSKNIQEARENIKTITGKSFERDNEAKKKRNFVVRGYRYIKNLF